jgi:hypothetical protein
MRARITHTEDGSKKEKQIAQETNDGVIHVNTIHASPMSQSQAVDTCVCHLMEMTCSKLRRRDASRVTNGVMSFIAL